MSATKNHGGSSRMVRLSTLGQLELEGSSFRQAKPLLLLAYLVVEGRQPRRRMAQLLWPTGNSMKSLSMAITRLRHAVPDCCEADGTHVWTASQSDVRDLEDATHSGDIDRCLALYRGGFLEGVELTAVSHEAEEWVFDTQERIAGRFRSVMLVEAERLATSGSLEAGAELVARAVTLGSTASAAADELRRLHALLSAARHPLAVELREELDELTPASVEGSVTRGVNDHLRLPANPFVGRERELALLGAQFAAAGSRLITVLGPGGSGKTRLALEACASAQRWGSFDDGVYCVMLASLTDEHDLPTVIGRALTSGAAPVKDAWLHLGDVIGSRRVLLFLDNVEQLRSAAPRLAELVATCPHLKVLVTSRERLGVADEHVLHLGGLAYGSPASERADGGPSAALQLLIDRALTTRIDLDVGRHEKALDRVCRSLEGLPLGLELAAGMLRTMSPHELAELVERDPGALESMSHAAAADTRHGSLRSVAAASWHTLPDVLREALRSLSVFEGGFKRPMAVEAFGVGDAMLAEAIDRSWLSVAGDGRFRMHPYLHAYLRKELAATPKSEQSARDAHAGWYVAFAAAASARLRGPGQVEAFDALSEEHDNLVAALTHLELRKPVAALALAVDLGYFWGVRGHHANGLCTVLRLLDKTTAGDALSAAAWNRAGHLATRANDFRSARAYFEKGLALASACTDSSLQADALIGIGATLMQGHGDYAGARERYQEGLARASQVDDYQASCDALRYLGAVHTAQGHYLQGKVCYEESLSLAEAAGDSHAAAKVSINLATVLAYLGEHARARLLNARSLDAMRAAGDLYGEAVVLINLAVEATNDDDLTTSSERYKESYALFRRLGDKTSASQTLNNRANLHLRLGQPEEAQRLLEESLDLLRNTGDVEQTAFASFLYANALLDLGDRHGAKARLDVCIELCRGSEDNWALMRALLILARWHAEGGQEQAAIRAVNEAEQLAHTAGDKKTLEEAVQFRLTMRSTPRP